MKSAGEGGNLAVKTVVQFFNINGLFFWWLSVFFIKKLVGWIWGYDIQPTQESS